MSYRTPRFNVSLWFSAQLSWTNPPYVGFVIEYDVSPSEIVYWVGFGYVLGSLKFVGSFANVNCPNAGSGKAPQKCGRKYWTPIFRLCSPCQLGTKYENRSFTWMFISFHHCGELVGDPRITDGKESRTQ